MMSTFDDRENALEAKFAYDQEKEFRAEMMALRQIAVWGVSLMQISPDEKEHRTADLHSFEMQKGAKALILAKLADDLSEDVDQDAITTTYDLFLRDAREKMGMIPPV
jgi:hypothetical protein